MPLCNTSAVLYQVRQAAVSIIAYYAINKGYCCHCYVYAIGSAALSLTTSAWRTMYHVSSGLHFSVRGRGLPLAWSPENSCLGLDCGMDAYCVYTVSQKKTSRCYFLNNSVKHWLTQTVIIFSMQHHHHKETWRRPKWLQFCSPHLNTLNTVATLPCEMQKS